MAAGEWIQELKQASAGFAAIDRQAQRWRRQTSAAGPVAGLHPGRRSRGAQLPLRPCSSCAQGSEDLSDREKSVGPDAIEPVGWSSTESRKEGCWEGILHWKKRE